MAEMAEMAEAKWEWWFENLWAPEEYRALWRPCDRCEKRASWLRWNRQTGEVDYACADHLPPDDLHD